MFKDQELVGVYSMGSQEECIVTIMLRWKQLRYQEGVNDANGFLCSHGISNITAASVLVFCCVVVDC
jgi:hypothetical protein